MPETPQAQDILKRLIEAENRAQQILEAAEQQARETISEAAEQAKQSVEATRKEMSALFAAQLAEAQTQGAVLTKQRLTQAEDAAQEIEEHAQEHFAQAVDLVVKSVTNQDG